MAFCGYVNASGDIVLREEIYMGDTLIRRPPSPIDSRSSMSSPVSLPQHLTRTNSAKEDTDVSDDATAEAAQFRSPDGWSLMYGELKKNHGVPSLLLDSRPSSVDYMRHIDAMKEYRKPDAAFENWYSGKRRQSLEKRKVLQQARDYEQEQAKERKQLAEMCYDQWLKGKARQAAAQRVETHMQTAAFKASQSLTKVSQSLTKTNSVLTPATTSGSSTFAGSGSVSVASPSANKALRNVSQDKASRNVSQDKIRQVVQDWWLKKQQLHQSQREEKRRALASQALEQQRRKELAQLAWQRWMSNVDEKPKPVPLNQGMDSLRGTISPIYRNPRSWVDATKPSKM